MTTNPIMQLAEQVYQGIKTPVNALEEVVTSRFLEAVGEEEINEIHDEIRHSLGNPKRMYILTFLILPVIGGKLEENQPCRASDHYRKALEYIPLLGIQAVEIIMGLEARLKLGNSLFDCGELAKAEKQYFRAWNLAQDNKDFLRDQKLQRLSIIQYQLGKIYRDRGEFKQALHFMDEGIRIADVLGDPVTMGKGYILKGNLQLDGGEIEASAISFLKALKTTESTGDTEVGIDAHLGNGNVSRAKGPIAEAEAEYKKALELSITVCDLKGMVESYGNLGHCYSDLGKRGEAHKQYRKARYLSNKLSDKRVLSTWCNNLGHFYQGIGKLDKAEKEYDRALGITRQIGDRRREGIVLCNLGSLQLDKAESAKESGIRRRHLVNAVKMLEEALEVAQSTENHRSLGQIQCNLGNAKRWLYQVGRALAASRDARQKAKMHYQNALIEAGKIRDVETEWLTHMGLGNLYAEAWKDPRQGFDEYLKAITIVEDQRYNLEPGESRHEFLRKKILLYEKMILCCVALGDWPRALYYLEQAKARSFRDKLDASHAEDNRTRIKGVKPWLEDLHHQIRLEADGAIVEFAITEIGTLALVIRNAQNGKSFQVHGIWMAGFNRDDLQQLMLKRDEKGQKIIGGWLNDYMNQKGVTQDPWNKTLLDVPHQLWNKFFCKVDKYLSENHISRLILVPHQMLHLLPLHAISYDRDDRQHYLLEDYSISYAPSLTVLGVCRERGKGQPGDFKLCAIANPNHPDLDPLPFAEAEGYMLQELFPSELPADRLLIYNQATSTAFFEKSKESTILHLASHASHNWLNYSESSIRLTDGKLTLKVIGEKTDLNLSDIRLITLSACESGVVNPADPTDDYLGLSAGFMVAQVPAVVSTLWKSEDLSTFFLMKTFYSGIKNGLDKALALRKAQKFVMRLTIGKAREELRQVKEYLKKRRDHLLREEEKKRIETIISKINMRLASWENMADEVLLWEHPKYWAPFIITGDWDKLL